ncbi:hypothetical protein SLE2022_313140 [Rubroshorea leprosula]
MQNTLRQPSAMFLNLAIREGALFENAVAELLGCGIDMGTLRFSPEGMSLTVESDGGSVVAALRILANGGGCDWFLCLESASATLNITTLLEILFEASNGKSALSISIDPRNGNNSDEPNTSEFKDVSSPATLAVSWFDPDEIACPLDDYCEMQLEVRKVAGENALLKLDESEYQTSAGISPAGFATLFLKLKDVRTGDNRTNDEIKVMALISNTKKLGFYTCCMGWVHEEEGGIEVQWEGQGDEMISMGIYNFVFLCKRIFAAKAVMAQRMYFHIQDGVGNLLRCPLGSGELGHLHFYSLHSRLRIPLVNEATFEFVNTL